MKPWNSIPRSVINQPNGVAGLDVRGQVPNRLASGSVPTPKLVYLTTNSFAEHNGALPTSSVAGPVVSYETDANVPGGRVLQIVADNSGGGSELDFYVSVDLPAVVYVNSHVQFRMWCDNPQGLAHYIYLREQTGTSTNTPGWYTRFQADGGVAGDAWGSAVASEWRTQSWMAYNMTSLNGASEWLTTSANGGTTVGSESVAVQRVQWRFIVAAGESATIKIGPVAFCSAPKGAIMIDFDDIYSTDYTTAWPMMQAAGLRPGNINVIPDQIGQEGKCSLAQLLEMQAAGWCMVGHKHDIISSDLSEEQVREVVATGQSVLRRLGLTSGDMLFLPHGNSGTHPLMWNILAERGIRMSRGSAYRTLSDGREIASPLMTNIWNSWNWRSDPYNLAYASVSSGSTEGTFADSALQKRYIDVCAHHRIVGIVYTHAVMANPTTAQQTPEWMADMFAHIKSLVDAGTIEPYHDYASWFEAMRPAGEVYYDAEGWLRSRTTGLYVM